jgi:hypothetical protein
MQKGRAVYGSHLVPERVSMKHTKRHPRKPSDFEVIGVDSETLQGPPITIQFYSEHSARKINGCVFIGKRPAVSVFLGQLGKLKPGRYRMYGHNLEFDMLSFLWEVRAKIRDGNIDLRIGDWEIKGRYSKPIFCVFTDGKRYIEIVDSFLWFMSSLEKVADRVCPHLPKLQRPAGLGDTLYKPTDKIFVPYAIRDAEIAFFAGLAIEEYHKRLGVPSQISLASMGAAVFRTKYMQADIYQPPLYEWMVGAAASYHGGINRVRPGAELCWHHGVTSVDLSSAYPDAWQYLPDFSDPNGYKSYRAKRVGKGVPVCGVYQISGSADACDWPALCDHNFKPLNGKFRDTWVTGWELNEALRTNEIQIDKIKGYHYESKSDYSPFREYARFFYEQKSSEKDPVISYMHKITLNAPTGKLIQTSPDFTLVDGQLVKIRRAGGLYHPFAASLTTGHTRAKIHALEHKYGALHTATDGIFAPGFIKGDKRKELGAVIAEGYGDLALLRNKLYIFYTEEIDGKTYPSQVFGDRHILKCARHGYQGTVVDLERMLITPNVREYKINKPVKLKTSLKKGSENVANKFVTTVRRLNIGGQLEVKRYGKTGVQVGRSPTTKKHASKETRVRAASIRMANR